MEEVIRPPAEKRKIHSRNEFELCYIRHQYFRRVKYNPSKEEMSPYKRIVHNLAYKTYHTYPNIFETIGMNFDDVKAIGNIHLVNFIGLFELDRYKNVTQYEKFVDAFRKKNPGKEVDVCDILNKNKANFTLFLKQRMEDVVRVCRQKAKNIRGYRMETFMAFYGPQKPPENIFDLIENQQAYGYKKVDNASFKAAKKRVKAKDEPFQHAGFWYVAVPLEPRSLTLLDLAGSGWDPHESEYNMGPEDTLLKREAEKKFDKQVEMFKNQSDGDKAKILLDFIEKNVNNLKLQEEIGIARKFLSKMKAADEERVDR